MTELDTDALDRWITGDYGARAPEPSGSFQCPECGCEDVSDRQGHIRPDGDDRPPWLMVCEGCGHEWEEDE